MTRIAVCGTVDDPMFVFRSLDEVNKVYGPVTCVIHCNNPAALMWQQQASRRQLVRHMPIDGGVPAKRRDALFAAKPEYLVVFQTPGPGGRDENVKKLVYKAEREGLEILTFETPIATRAKRAA